MHKKKRKQFLHLTDGNKACRLLRVTRLWFLKRDIAAQLFLMHFFQALSRHLELLQRTSSLEHLFPKQRRRFSSKRGSRRTLMSKGSQCQLFVASYDKGATRLSPHPLLHFHAKDRSMRRKGQSETCSKQTQSVKEKEKNLKWCWFRHDGQQELLCYESRIVSYRTCPSQSQVRLTCSWSWCQKSDGRGIQLISDSLREHPPTCRLLERVKMFPPIKRSRKEQTLFISKQNFFRGLLYLWGRYHVLQPFIHVSYLSDAWCWRASRRCAREHARSSQSCFEGVGSPHFFKTDVSGLLWASLLSEGGMCHVGKKL